MRADFFRNLFHKTEKGIYYTAALKDEIREIDFHFTYIAEEAKPVKQERHSLDLLALGDWKEQTIRQARDIIASRSVAMVVMPQGPFTQEAEMRDWCDAHQVKELHFTEDTWEYTRGRWEFRCICLEGEQGNILAVYHGFTGGGPAQEDCAFAAKPFSREDCSSGLCEEKDHCGFGCIYRKDFDVLNGHKGKNSQDYCLGTLLMGGAVSGGNVLPEEFLREIREKIRCVQLPYGTECDPKYVCELFGDREDYLYVIGHEMGCSDLAAGRISNTSPRLRYMKIGKDYGFCASGYRIPYMKSEKRC